MKLDISKKWKWGGVLLTASFLINLILLYLLYNIVDKNAIEKNKERTFYYENTSIYLDEDKLVVANTNDQYRYREDYFMNFYSAPTDIVFLGDSMTYRFDWASAFPEFYVQNRGIGSDTTLGVLERMDTISQTRPSNIFLMIGINDVGRKMPIEESMENYEKILDYCQREMPDTTIYVQSILPVREPSQVDNELVVKFNECLKTYCEEQNITYIDLYTQFVDSEGKLKSEYSFDGVHLTSQGYAVWINELRTVLCL